MAIALIREVEELAASAYAADVVEELGGWQLRYSAASARRGNSVWPNLLEGGLALEERLRRVEEFYAGHGRPARYQMTPAAQPPELDQALARRGYGATAPTLVQVAPVEDVLVGALACRALGARVSSHLDQEWLDAATSIGRGAHGLPEPGADQAGRGVRTGYALLREGAAAIAYGRAVVERGWLGLFDIVTAEPFRRRGAATAVLYALAAWGKARGARQIYLQVMEENLGARTLYARAGFETLYKYFYREQGTGNRG